MKFRLKTGEPCSTVIPITMTSADDRMSILEMQRAYAEGVPILIVHLDPVKVRLPMILRSRIEIRGVDDTLELHTYSNPPVLKSKPAYFLLSKGRKQVMLVYELSESEKISADEQSALVEAGERFQNGWRWYRIMCEKLKGERK